jgi:hypothetical protein
MMKKTIQWMMAAILICGATLFTACTSNDDNPVTPDLNLADKIIGKWILAETNGSPTPTNNKYVITFTSPTQAYLSASLNAHTEIHSLWGDRQKVDVAMSGNMVKNTMVINEHLTVIDDMKITSITNSDTWGDLKISWIVDGTVIKTVEENIRTVKITTDYREAVLGLWECTGLTGGETYNDANGRLEFYADGTYNYWRQNEAGEWESVTSTRELQNYFVDGTLLATRWKNQGEDELHEWWEIDSISGDEMVWKALRQNANGSTFQQKMTWKKIM